MVKYIIADADSVSKNLTIRDLIRHLSKKIEEELDDFGGFIKVRRLDDDSVYYFNSYINGFFLENSFLLKGRYIKLPTSLTQNPFTQSEEAFDGIAWDFMTEYEFKSAFSSITEEFCSKLAWNPSFAKCHIILNNDLAARMDTGEITSIFQNSQIPYKASKIGYILKMARVSDEYLRPGASYEDILNGLLFRGFVPIISSSQEAMDKLNMLKDFYRNPEYVLVDNNGCRALDCEKIDSDPSGYKESVDQNLLEPSKDQIASIKKRYLECDKRRVAFDSYDESVFSAKKGHWELWRFVQYNDKSPDDLPKTPEGQVWVDVSKMGLYARNPAKDITSHMIACDFGTTSTVVSVVNEYRTINFKIIGQVPSDAEINGEAYENPTILKFTNITKFMEAYHSPEYIGRPDTSINDIDFSYSAESGFEARNLDANIESFLHRLKQWASNRVATENISDDNDYKIEKFKLKPYLTLDDDDFDPVEIYAYYIGLYINNMMEYKIYSKYFLSYPSAYSTQICEKIQRSFEKGLKKSIPSEALQSEGFKEKFKVSLSHCEPMAYSSCAIMECQVMPTPGRKVFVATYDMGGGTVDYSFGLLSLEKTPPMSYKNLSKGGDPLLGCENLLEILAVDIFYRNKEIFRSYGVKFEKTSLVPDFQNHQYYMDTSKEARLNSLKFIKELREVWKNNGDIASKSYSLSLSFFPSGKTASIPFTLTYASEEPQDLEPAFNSTLVRIDESGLSQAPGFHNAPSASARASSSNFEIIGLAGDGAHETHESELYPDVHASTEDNHIITLPAGYIKTFFQNKIKAGVDEFFTQMDRVYASHRDELGNDPKCVIFLAGNASKSKLVKEAFIAKKEANAAKLASIAAKETAAKSDAVKSVISRDSRSERKPLNFELKDPLPIEVKTKGMQVRAIPTAKTGVAYGLLIDKPSPSFIKPLKELAGRSFMYYIGVEKFEISKSTFKSFFLRKCKPEELVSETNSQNGVELGRPDASPFILLYTDNLSAETSERLPRSNIPCVYIDISEELLGKSSLRCRVFDSSETLLQIFAVVDDRQGEVNLGFCDLAEGFFHAACQNQ
jgi:hypothetical protein